MTDTPSFYQDHVPQSEYRRELSKIRDRQSVDTDVKPLIGLSPELKQLMMQKIEDESDRLATILLPPSCIKTLQKSEFLTPIFRDLGLL